MKEIKTGAKAEPKAPNKLNKTNTNQLVLPLNHGAEKSTSVDNARPLVEVEVTEEGLVLRLRVFGPCLVRSNDDIPLEGGRYLGSPVDL